MNMYVLTTISLSHLTKLTVINLLLISFNAQSYSDFPDFLKDVIL